MNWISRATNLVGPFITTNGQIEFRSENEENAEWLRDVLNYCESVLWAGRQDASDIVSVSAPGKVRWFHRQVNDMTRPFVGERPPENWVEVSEAMALKHIWEKGKEIWMEVWKACPEAQEAMATWARDNTVLDDDERNEG